MMFLPVLETGNLHFAIKSNGFRVRICKQQFPIMTYYHKNFGFVKFFAISLYFSFTRRNTSQTRQEHKQHVNLKLELQNFLGYACHTLSSQGVA